MKIVLCICTLSIILCVVDGIMYHYPADPAYPNECFSELTGVMTRGEERYLSDCSKALCEDGGVITVFLCGVIHQAPCGIIPQDDSKPYPQCCPKPVTPCSGPISQSL